MIAGIINPATRSQLNPGDHICTDRWRGLYYHHGIYVGDYMVIHVVGRRQGTGGSTEKFRFASVISRSSSSGTKRCIFTECQNYRSHSGGTIKTCLDCFLDGRGLYVFDYECRTVRWYVVEKHSAAVNSLTVVVNRAENELEQNEFGAGYHLYGKNCEHFATYCKTGLAFSMQSICAAAVLAIIFFM